MIMENQSTMDYLKMENMMDMVKLENKYVKYSEIINFMKVNYIISMKT